MLRNPSETVQAFGITPEAALELPAGVEDAMALHAIYPPDRELPGGVRDESQSIELLLQPFETVVLELRDVDSR